jgi:HK97 family phage prohead protease
MLPDDLERRVVAELRAESTRIVGHAVILDVRSVAVARALRPESAVVALYNHDAGAVLGRQADDLGAGEGCARGLAFILAPAPTSAGQNALVLVRRGDITGASFGFRTLQDAWHEEAGVLVRELLDVEIVEISLTAFPADSGTDISIAQRALEAVAARAPLTSSIRWLTLRERVRR